MTNEQMIRELRAVAEKYKGKHVFTCETNINLMATDAANRIESLCEEISRQKAEIERLQKYHDSMEEAIYSFREDQAAVKFFKDRIRAEAIKEFAERLKSKHRRILDYDEAGFSAKTDIVYVETIDNLVKEFTEGG